MTVSWSGVAAVAKDGLNHTGGLNGMGRNGNYGPQVTSNPQQRAAAASTLLAIPQVLQKELELVSFTAIVPRIPIGTPRGVPINGAVRNVPLGFQSEAQFLTASKELNDIMISHGIRDATVGVRGSSVTGFGGNPKSSTFEKPFGSNSDIDLFVESAQVVSRFKKQPNFVHPEKMTATFQGLEAWSKRWSEALGRPVSPGGWKPGTLPPTPAILVR